MRRSKHSLSHYKLLSCDMGELVPISVLEVLPGDSIQHAANLIVRASPMLAPVMHQVDVTVRHFFVPNRLVWVGWEDFITGGPDGNNDYEHPFIRFNAGDCDTGTLPDYMGIPDIVAPTDVNALPFRAYNLIWNEYFRDEDLQSKLAVDTASGQDTETTFALQRVNWAKDYFTTARPWEQKGPNISVPIESNDMTINVRAETTPSTDRDLRALTTNVVGFTGAAPAANTNMRFGSETGLEVELGAIREAFALQRFEEARARFGSRYVEYLRYLGVRSSDARLQRPEYLGGGTGTVQISEVLQTAEGTDPVGDLKGHGIGAMRSNRYRRFFEEHGYIISLMFIRPTPIYMHAIQRLWWKGSKEDYYQKELQHIGQQPVYNREVYALANPQFGIFGYQDRYDEYRRSFSTVAGEFRNTLAYWHMGRDFSSTPALNSAFITCNPSERSFAVPGQDVFNVMARHSIQARRIITKTGNQSYVY